MGARVSRDVTASGSYGEKLKLEDTPWDVRGTATRASGCGADHGDSGLSVEEDDGGAKNEHGSTKEDESENSDWFESDKADRQLQFLYACANADERAVRRLLNSGGVDANARYEVGEAEGMTALMLATENDYERIVELLIAHRVDVNATEPRTKKMALHWARGDVVLKMLLRASAHPNPADNFGKTPLHNAALHGQAETVAVLLHHGAAVDAVNKQGLTPLGTLVQAIGEKRASIASNDAFPTIAQTLVSYGAKWDDACDEIISDTGVTINLGLREAILWWMDEHARGVQNLTHIPEEVFQRGPSAVEQYLAAIHASDRIVLRRKVCVVGPSFWGKTSLVKSISIGKPVLEHAEDRTIGIDQLALSFTEKLLSDEAVLMEACRVGDTEIVRWLLNTKRVDLRSSRTGAGAAGEEEGTHDELRVDTPLHCAIVNKRLDIVQLLLDFGANLDVKSQAGSTPLVLAILAGNIEIVEALLTAGADPNVADSIGRTTLRLAVARRFTNAVRLLLRSGAHVNCADKHGLTPLHWCDVCPEMTSALLKAGANIHAVTDEGQSPFDRVATEVVQIIALGIDHVSLSPLLEAARAMVSYGANCDNIIGDGRERTSAFREAVLVWLEEREQGIELTSLPSDVLLHGPTNVREYARREAHLPPIALSSSPQGYPSVELHDEFIIEINSESQPLNTSHHASLELTTNVKPPKSLQQLDVHRHHDVVFWDFAGQEAYQVAHSPFFTKRTLYLVCVDLHAYAVALEHTELRADNESGSQRLMDEFVDSKILRWIRLILARQPDAEFVFVGTKADVLVRTQHRIVNAHQDLLKRVNAFARSIESKSLDSNERLGRRYLGMAPSSTLGVNDNPFSRALGASAKRLRQMKWLVVNCKDEESVQAARKEIEEIIINSKRSFQMPDLYSQVLQVILKRRKELHQQQSSNQVKATFKTAADVCSLLRSQLAEQKDNLSDAACKAILRTLHDIGDVLWFEDLEIDYFKNRVILHPLVLIDFVRQIVHHKHSTEVMAHAALKELPYWDDLDPELMLVMKQLLQQFHLVHPAGSTMKRDSDMIVPAFWRSGESALWLFGGDLLLNEPSLKEMTKDYCVQWEYHFTTALPDVIFDELVIESFRRQYKRRVGPDWILYKVDEKFACRIVITRAPKTFERVLRVEAIATEAATLPMWGRFEHLCESLEKVLSRYKGLLVSRFHLLLQG